MRYGSFDSMALTNAVIVSIRCRSRFSRSTSFWRATAVVCAKPSSMSRSSGRNPPFVDSRARQTTPMQRSTLGIAAATTSSRWPCRVRATASRPPVATTRSKPSCSRPSSSLTTGGAPLCAEVKWPCSSRRSSSPPSFRRLSVARCSVCSRKACGARPCSARSPTRSSISTPASRRCSSSASPDGSGAWPFHLARSARTRSTSPWTSLIENGFGR